MMPLLTPFDIETAESILRRIVRGRLASEIHVIDAGIDENDREWLTLGCDSRLACQHAMVSIGSYSDMPVEEWRSGWTEGSGFPYTLRVAEFSQDLFQPR